MLTQTHAGLMASKVSFWTDCLIRRSRHLFTSPAAHLVSHLSVTLLVSYPGFISKSYIDWNKLFERISQHQIIQKQTAVALLPAMGANWLSTLVIPHGWHRQWTIDQKSIAVYPLHLHDLSPSSLPLYIMDIIIIVKRIIDCRFISWMKWGHEWVQAT